MRRFHASLMALLLGLGSCGGCNEKPPARALESAPPPEPLTETPAALSPAELEPGKPIDLGDGLILQVDRAGGGKTAHAGSRVQLRFEYRVKDAETALASNEDWDTPLAVTLGGGDAPRLLPALERALTGLRAGCLARLEVPPALGYGKSGPPGTEDQTLVFQLELLGVD